MIETVADVSVIIPCFRSKATILRAVDSVFHQTMRPLEIILVDDFSDDGTLDYLYAIKARYLGNWIKILALEKNQGAGTARNIGWDNASGKYIALLDSDDSWHPQKIEIQYKWMETHPAADMTGHACSILASEHGGVNEYHPDEVEFFVVRKNVFLFSNLLPTRSIMLRRALSFRFKEKKRYSEDYHLWLEMLFSGCRCYRTEKNLAFSYKANYGQSGLSASLWRMEKGELDSYRNLFRKRMINRVAYGFFCLFSLIKFARRILLVKLIEKSS